MLSYVFLVDMMLGGEMDPLLDSQEELLGVPATPPASVTSRAAPAVANSEGSKKGRQNSEPPHARRLSTSSNH